MTTGDPAVDDILGTAAGLFKSDDFGAAIKLAGLLAYLAIIEKVRMMEKADLLHKTTQNLPLPDAPAGTVTVTVTPQKGTP